MNFSEDSRVKIPCILHLVRLGYRYLSLQDASWDEETDIFPKLFHAAIADINPGMETTEIGRLLADVKLLLDNEDLGKAFYERLIERSGTRLIDFENFDNNHFHVVTELTCKNGGEEFRPDITLLINGMPLAFIEVKKPNNREGVLAERNRIITRSRNPRFRRFINITQLMVFSNNMEYDDCSPQPVEGAFYASPSYDAPIFNYFREEETLDLAALLADEDDAVENEVLRDNNLNVIKHSPEFLSNKSPATPTNRLCTSLFSRKRLSFLLQYALVYVNEANGLHKHVMRYPQIFATKTIEKKLDAGVKKGIIWHTQGSGKTALAYYNTRFLTDYFQRRGIIPKFYFIVDRIDLLNQAQREFAGRGLTVHTIDSREAFARDIKATQALHNHAGRPEITVVNIQKFQDDPDVVRAEDYDVSIQRVYFLDEVHRSYNPKGSFLANLSQSDQNAIKIGLTGTPLLGDDYNSRALFGDYIHKYYYNASIADGYTLRLIREEIATNYKLSLQEALAAVELQQGDIDRKLIYAHPRFVEPMLDYIISDFEKSRSALGDASIGGMVICDSAEQARQMFDIFNAVYAAPTPAHVVQDSAPSMIAAAQPDSYAARTLLANRAKTAALILHDVGSKNERKQWVADFKAGEIDLLFVYNMLLTGFDAKRLKKLYLGRIIRAHNLLQALTRVNRPYKEFRYGYVVDFADIRREFDKTNQDYFDELQSELGDEIEHYSNLFKSAEEITQEIEAIKDILFSFNIENAEEFSRQMSQIQDRATVLALKKALADARNLYNLNRQNNQLRAKYQGDAKYTRIHKRLQERGNVTQTERNLFEALSGVKARADEQVLQNTQLLNNESYFERMMQPIVIGEFSTRQHIKLTPNASPDDMEMLQMQMGPDTARLRPEHFIAHLFGRQNAPEFAKLFDDTLRDIAITNNDIFAVKTDGGAKITLFDRVSEFITDPSKRDAFCRAIINKLGDFSFERIFNEKYDFYAALFEYLIKDYNKDSGGKYAEYYTPHAVAKIMAAILVPEAVRGKVSNVSCYDPSAGSGTLLMNIAHAIGEQRCSIYSQDISQKSSSLLRLNLILNNLVHSIPNIIQGNTMTHPWHRDGKALKKFDYIVSNPPFKMDFSDFRNELDTKAHSERFFAGVYDVDVRTINYHLKKVFSDSEPEPASVIRNFRITAADGKSYDTRHYNLAAIHTN